MKPTSKGIVHHEGMTITHWRPTIADRVRIAFGQPIRLCIMGNDQPVVSLDTKETIVS